MKVAEFEKQFEKSLKELGTSKTLEIVKNNLTDEALNWFSADKGVDLFNHRDTKENRGILSTMNRKVQPRLN